MKTDGRTTSIVEQDTECGHPKCPIVTRAGCEMYHSRGKARLYHSFDCRARDIKRRAQLDRRNHHPDQKNYERAQKLLAKYGITVEEWEALFLKQDGKCALCRKPFDPDTKAGKAHTDHDHKTGKVRGLLCSNCNVGLGYFQDDTALLLTAVSYLEGAG